MVLKKTAERVLKDICGNSYIKVSVFAEIGALNLEGGWFLGGGCLNSLHPLPSPLPPRWSWLKTPSPLPPRWSWLKTPRFAEIPVLNWGYGVIFWGGVFELVTGEGEGGSGRVGGTHHALQLDVINVLTCGQKEELKVCTCLYSCVALHHGILPPPPPPVNRRTETLKT